MSADPIAAEPGAGHRVSAAKSSPTTSADTTRARTLVLHVGLPKAASSYLHVNVFPQLVGNRYVMPGAANAKKDAYRFRRNRYGVRRFSDAFQKSPDFWCEHGEAFLCQYTALARGDGAGSQSLLISDEAITRVNHFGIRTMPAAFDPGQLRANLEGLSAAARRVGFDRVRVLVMTRRQDTLLAASYVQQSRKIPGACQQDFEQRVQRLLDRSPSDLEAAFYGIDYGRLFDCLADVLGSENVSIVPIEMIGADFDAFVRTMRDLLDVGTHEAELSQAPVNTRSREANRWGLRPLLLYKSRHSRMQITVPPRWSGRASEIELREPLAKGIRDHFESQNLRVAEAIGRDLAGYGYYG